MSSDERNDVQFSFFGPKSMEKAIDQWRKKQPTLPGKSGACRTLIAEALAAHERNDKAKRRTKKP